VDRIQAGTTTPDYPQNQGEARLWIKEIVLLGDHENCLQILRDELKKIFQANPAE
jgi:hypothetical protein